VLVGVGRASPPPLDRETALELAEREGIKAVVAGEVNSAGRSFVVTARLIAAAGGVVLASHRETASDSTALIGAVDRLSKHLRQKVGESLRSLRSNEPLEQVSTTSIAALRLYSQAVRVAEVERDAHKARALLEEAVRIDTTFAMAYRKLGVVLGNSGAQRADVDAALRSAHRHRDRLPERERYLTLATYYRSVERDADRAASAYEAVLDRYPHETVALNNLALIYGDRREFGRAEALLHRAIALDSSNSLRYTNLMTQLVAQGRLDEADAVLEVYRRLFPAHAEARLVAAGLAANRSRWQEVGEILEELAAERGLPLPERINAQVTLAQFEALRGMPRAAEARMRRALALLPADMRAPGGFDDRHGLELGLALFELHLFGDRAAAASRVERVLGRYPLADVSPAERPYGDLVRIYADLGRAERAEAMYHEQHETLHPDELAQRRPALRIQRALIDRASGRFDEAIAALRVAQAESPCAICLLPELAETYALAARPDSAIAVYRRYLETPWLSRLEQDAFYRPITHLGLAELYADQGRHDEAADHYARLLDLWRDAEPALQPRVEQVRRELLRLRQDAA
jgi:eukaryotic-like serine/threonine-protein kinase